MAGALRGARALPGHGQQPCQEGARREPRRAKIGRSEAIQAAQSPVRGGISITNIIYTCATAERAPGTHFALKTE